MATEKSQIRIIMAQMNSTVGAINDNTQKIIQYIQQARDEFKADLIVFPELCITGYPPEDLLLRPDLYIQVEKALDQIIAKSTGIDVLVSFPKKTPQGLYNAAAYLREKSLIASYHKQHLPNYGVFDEKRYFIPGQQPCVVNCKGTNIGITICEDLWQQGPYRLSVEAGAEIVVSINASPFDIRKSRQRESILRERINMLGVPIIYVHCVGGQDEIVFDGGSIAMSQGGRISHQAPFYEEGLYPVDIIQDKPVQLIKAPVPEKLSAAAAAYKALCLGVKDYINKNHFKGVILGLSGGIDSALVLAIAVDALGADRVEAIFMPSEFTSEMSREDSTALAKNLGVNLHSIPICNLFNNFKTELQPYFNQRATDVTEENIQARIRGSLLMAFSNKFGQLVLTTGNKSEMAVGYATLYGDMAGGFAVLKDVPKTLVYQLCEYRNSLNNSPAIPQRIITRAPTAELAHDQEDQDSLPPYDILDQILERYVEKDQDLLEITAAGFEKQMVKKVIQLVDRSEYKRRQAPPGVRITTRAFGRDRRYPITSGFTHDV